MSDRRASRGASAHRENLARSGVREIRGARAGAATSADAARYWSRKRVNLLVHPSAQARRFWLGNLAPADASVRWKKYREPTLAGRHPSPSRRSTRESPDSPRPASSRSLRKAAGITQQCQQQGRTSPPGGRALNASWWRVAWSQARARPSPPHDISEAAERAIVGDALGGPTRRQGNRANREPVRRECRRCLEAT
jgi:hypothetical protein